MTIFSNLPRVVIMVGLVSFLTDVSSEMIYPLLPLFLAEVLGATALSLGIIEGVAEATSSLFKVYSGWLTDRSSKRKPLVFWGYGISGLARPLIGLAGSWVVVLVLRFFDRIGKGIRSSPRDALIADVTPAEKRGAAYGLHRAMDHSGAVVGPLVAAGLMTYLGFDLRTVFLCSAVPAVLTMFVIALGVKEEPRPVPVPTTQRVAPLKDLKAMPASLRKVLLCFFVFTLGNSTDAFLLLTLADAGVEKSTIGIIWSVLHVVKVIASWGGGKLSDKVGHRRMILAGWFYFALIYFAFAFVRDKTQVVALFLAYGVYFGFVEPSEKALIAEVAPPEHRGKAFGLMHFTLGIGLLPASLLFGWLWTSFGQNVAFLTGAGLALLAAIGLTIEKQKKN